MDLLPSADQEQILDTARSFLADRAPVDRLREHGAIGNPDAKLWREFAELGFIGLALPEELGGVGLSSSEEMLVFRELGRHVVSPAIFGLVLGARVAARSGDTALRDSMLAGQVAVGLANPRFKIAPGLPVSGEFHLFEATEAEWLLYVSRDGAGLFRRSDFRSIQPVAATDATLALERALLDAAPPAHWVSAGDDPLYHRALLLVSAYAVGLGEGARDMAVDYAKVREQFGKPIGAFQAIKHICADMAIRSEAALCQASFASLVFAENRGDMPFHVVSSKLVATDTAIRNSGQNIQVHGAFGFTAEANAHHYLKRSHVADLLFGDTREQRADLIQMGPSE